MITRRTFIASAAAATAIATVPVAAPVTVSKLIGINDPPMSSQKFTGAGWYAFGRAEPGFVNRVYYAEPDRGGHLPGFIDLSQGPGQPVQISLSPCGFDECCIGECITDDEADRRAGTGRYAKGGA